jgi:hypothetical protein
MGLWIGVAVLAILLGWLFVPRRRPAPEPEDDVTTPIDRAELEQAEREVKRDGSARALDERVEDEDDWGPGTR